MMGLCEEMINYRAKHNMSQQKAADLANITIITWGNIERGIQTPSRLTESKIRSVIGREEVLNESVNQPD